MTAYSRDDNGYILHTGFTNATMLYQLKSHKHLLHVHDHRNNSRSINALILTLINWTIRFSSLIFFLSRTPNLGSTWKCQNIPPDIIINNYLTLFLFKQETKPKVLASRALRLPYNSAVRSLTEWHGSGNVYDKNLNESLEKVSKTHHKLIN